MHQHCVGADGLDLLPRNGQVLFPAQQAEQPGPPQQDQALQPGGGRVKGQVVGPAKADPLLHLHHLFFTQFPDGQCPLPFLPQLMQPPGTSCKKQWKPHGRLWYTVGRAFHEKQRKF